MIHWLDYRLKQLLVVYWRSSENIHSCFLHLCPEDMKHCQLIILIRHVILLISWLQALHPPTITTNCWLKTQSYSLSAITCSWALYYIFLSHGSLCEQAREAKFCTMIGYWVRVGKMGISCPLGWPLYPTSKLSPVFHIISPLLTKVIWSTCLDISLDLFCIFTDLN